MRHQESRGRSNQFRTCKGEDASLGEKSQDRERQILQFSGFFSSFLSPLFEQSMEPAQ
jgi:hypothetical protein